MKRFLALFLVLVLAFSCILVSCKKEEGEDPVDDDPGEGLIGINTGATTTVVTTLGPNTDDVLSETGTSTDFTWTDDTAGTMIYVIVDGVSVRSDTNTSNDTYRHTANFGETYKRIKYNDKWTLIDYKGSQYYIASAYITTDNGYVTFTNDAAETTVYVTASSLALRTNTYTGYNDNVKTYANYGVSLTRVATSANGKWIKVRCTYVPNGKTEPVTEVLCCKAEFVSTVQGGNSEVTAPPLG